MSMLKSKRVLSLLLCCVMVFMLLGGTTLTTSAASVSASLGYDQPENSGDYAYWNGSKVVKSGSTTKNEIKWMQAALNYCIQKEGLSATKLSVDGSFGPASKNATVKFQKAVGLTADGSFGPATIKKMKSVLNDGKKTFSNSIAFKNYLQVDSAWSSKVYGKGNIRDTGCGILSVVNAVYNLTGNFIEPTTLASWANKNGHYNKNGSEGSYATLFNAAAKKYGSAYGFKYVSGGSGKASDTKLISHIKNGGTAVVHVPGHFMAIVDYDENTNKFLVCDSAPGSGTSWNSIKRKGLTSPGGDWKTSSQLSSGNLKIDRYYLFSKA